MSWSEIRRHYPEQWLVIEALDATSSRDHRHLEDIAVVESCENGSDAFRRYRELHRRFPSRELYFVHTRQDRLEIEERPWMGIRLGDHAAPATA